MNLFAKACFVPDSEKAAGCEAFLTFVKRWHKMIESYLCCHKGKFAAGNNLTIADFVLAAYCANLLCNPNNPMSQQMKACCSETPKFHAYIMSVGENFPYLKTRPPIPAF